MLARCMTFAARADGDGGETKEMSGVVLTEEDQPNVQEKSGRGATGAKATRRSKGKRKCRGGVDSKPGGEGGGEGEGESAETTAAAARIGDSVLRASDTKVSLSLFLCAFVSLIPCNDVAPQERAPSRVSKIEKDMAIFSSSRVPNVGAR